jgi:hypothetical protein
MLGTPPKGKGFTECYDIASLRPTTEWLNMYKTVKEEAAKVGIPLD